MVSTTTNTSRAVVAFPELLHYILDELEKSGRSNIAAWKPHGRCFAVYDRKVLIDKVLSLWFRTTKYTSFLRQLNIYGFTRILMGPDKGSYYHPLFLRGQIALSRDISRTPVKRDGPSRATGLAAFHAPPFYVMDAIPPSTPTTAPPCLEGLINDLLAPLIPSTNAVQPFVPNVAQVQIAQRQEQNVLLRLLAEQEGERLQQQAIVLAGRHHLSNSTVVENNRYQPTLQSPLSEFLIARLGASRY